MILASALVATAACGVTEPPAWRTLQPVTDFGELTLHVYDDLFWWTAGIFVVVELLLVYALVRFRSRRKDSEVPDQVHGFTSGSGGSAADRAGRPRD